MLILDLARRDFPAAIDVLFTAAAATSDVDPDELGRLAVQAARYAEEHEAPDWLAEPQTDQQLVSRLRQQLATNAEQGTETLGIGSIWNAFSEGLDRVHSAASNVIGKPVWSTVRKTLLPLLATFVGDVFVYQTRRGTPAEPGAIATDVLTGLRTAADARTAQDPHLVVVAHSMGGIITYDLLSSFVPDLAVDVYVTVGSQVGLFEELKLFTGSQAELKTPAHVGALPNVGRWINVFDYNDVLSFQTEPIFDGAHDFPYATGNGRRAHRVLHPAGAAPAAGRSGARRAGRDGDHLTMTTLLDTETADTALHALIIGVGDYPHLPGGTGTTTQADLGLGQVSTPVPSALAVCNWASTEYGNAAAPLGSIELLISARDPYDVPLGGISVDRATEANVRDAVQRWLQRADRNPGNIALFYFCGHGVEKDNQYLLLEDYGANQYQPTEASIDLNGFHTGMLSCKAGTQLFFADACRQVPWDCSSRSTRAGRPPSPAAIRATSTGTLRSCTRPVSATNRTPTPASRRGSPRRCCPDCAAQRPKWTTTSRRGRSAGCGWPNASRLCSQLLPLARRSGWRAAGRRATRSSPSSRIRPSCRWS